MSQPENSRKTEKSKTVIPDDKKVQSKAAEFPAVTRINDYGLLHFKKRWLEELGWTKGIVLKIDRNEDGSITVKPQATGDKGE